MTQENVSRIERAEDTQLSTIRRYIEALGGSLELHAVFEDRDVPIAAAETGAPATACASARVAPVTRPVRSSPTRPAHPARRTLSGSDPD
jgi:hypothetical protein